MQFAICNETFQHWSLEETCDTVRRLGYEGLEIAPFTLCPDVVHASTADRRRWQVTIESSGLTAVGLHWLFARSKGYHLTSADEGIQERTSRYLIELCRFCRDLGGSVMVLGSPAQRRLANGMTRAAGLLAAEAVIGPVLPTLEACGVQLAIEPLGSRECNFLRSAEEAVELIRRLAHPRVRLHLDTKAMVQESHTIPEIITAHAEQLAHFHANDPNLLGPGMGALDFVPILRALQNVAYDRWISVEVFDLAPGPEAIARQSIEYLRRSWDAVTN